ncbi:DoxX family membrane protein [Nostoc sp. KVJ3]|uniref:DoxX family protein n=1 Tax=Nostoc sp. KVJ3 TaxID=457945 RepID=UPI002236F48F|nr:DoxX family protein [Nostoc sp. KVJ3]MCW5314716.1 DoxX family membrane protein [Nostoc sp. KVJ3]
MTKLNKAKKIALWSFTTILAALFLFVGTLKLTGAEQLVAEFTKFGLPSWFRLFVGVAEIAGAGLLIVPRTTTLGAAELGVLMAGCVFLHFKSGEAPQSIPAFVLIVLLAIAGYVRLPHNTLLTSNRNLPN